MPSMLEMVRQDFEECVLLDSTYPKALKESLRMKERVPRFINNLAAELTACETRGIKFDRMVIKRTVYDLTNMFMHLVMKRADEMAMSDLARSAKKAELEGNEIIQKFDDDGNADLTDELGIVITDKKE